VPPPASFLSSPKGELTHLLRLGRFLGPYRFRIAGALAALVVAASCVLALGQGLRYVIDAGFGSADPQLLNVALAAVVLAVFFTHPFRFPFTALGVLACVACAWRATRRGDLI